MKFLPRSAFRPIYPSSCDQEKKKDENSFECSFYYYLVTHRIGLGELKVSIYQVRKLRREKKRKIKMIFQKKITS